MNHLSTQEKSRIDALAALGILDTPEEPAFDRITRIAQRHFDVYAAAICFIDDTRLWTKSSSGPVLKEIPREITFCHHTIDHNSPLIVNDASRNPTFASSPFVVQEPRIRFYAGVPLVVGPDKRVGSMCLVDDKPRVFSDTDVRYLVSLAKIVLGELWLRNVAPEDGQIQDDNDFSLPSAKYDFSKSDELSPAQLRAARALADWSIAELSAAAKVSPNTIKRMEAREQQLKVRSSSSLAIREALESHGIVFHGLNGVSRNLE